jgi:hypothetical protein
MNRVLLPTFSDHHAAPYRFSWSTLKEAQEGRKKKNLINRFQCHNHHPGWSWAKSQNYQQITVTYGAGQCIKTSIEAASGA